MRTVYKHIIITGGARELGETLARYFLQRGASISLIDTERRALFDTVERLKSYHLQDHQRIEIATAHIEDRREIDQAINDLTLRSGACDILINAAAISISGQVPIEQHNVYEQAMSNNYFGVLYPIKAVLPAMMSRRSGNLVAFTLSPGSLRRKESSASVATHLAVQGLFHSLQRELRSHHISTSLVYLQSFWAKDTLEENPISMLEAKVQRVIQPILEGKKHIYPDWKVASSLRVGRLLQYMAEYKIKTLSLTGSNNAQKDSTDS